MTFPRGCTRIPQCWGTFSIEVETFSIEVETFHIDPETFNIVSRTCSIDGDTCNNSAGSFSSEVDPLSCRSALLFDQPQNRFLLAGTFLARA